jgi:hypothetical protein
MQSSLHSPFISFMSFLFALLSFFFSERASDCVCLLASLPGFWSFSPPLSSPLLSYYCANVKLLAVAFKLDAV